MLVAAELMAGHYVKLEDSPERWVVEAVENSTGMVVRLHLRRTGARALRRVVHVFPDELMATVATKAAALGAD